ncbi:M20 aminoacylase family protein [Thalassospira lucentensis]|uniref:M20 aminoacylase family protein n=1 Tax=Thalassospira lucentensis TaxID=168935 RepID=UPI00142E2A0B|nr:M20 aminoacylase family protein [Thalassospira lucentensis]NIZ01560.1 amidohydrolase [Thalassospira lucentensis]
MSAINADSIAAETEFLSRLVAIRHDIHEHPETAFEEERTSDLVAAFLENLGLPVHRGLAGTGVVATVKGRHEGNRKIGLRADMDALFIEEQTGLPYASKVPGKMHACGHDGHTTMLLGAAEKLAQNPDFAGTVYLIFQPAEEGQGGARVMINDGLFELFECDAVYGVHNGPCEPLGMVKTRPGAMMPAGDTWEVTFCGTGGHGAMPHTATDPTVAAGDFIASLSNIISRNIPSNDQAVISVGHMQAGAFDSPNIIPSSVLVRGTARSFKPQYRDVLEKRIGELAAGMATAHGVEAQYKFIRRYPPLVNHASETDLAVRAAKQAVGDKLVDGECDAVGGSEDFSFMLEKVPGAYVMIGNGDGPDSHFVHTPKFDFSDDLIPYGVAYWLNVVEAELGQTANG